MMRPIILPKYIKYALKKLESNGFEAYIVGGAVRDHILQRQINDYDITTQARPEQVKEIFKDFPIIDIGSKYGTIILVIDKVNVEITTYRTEASYDGRRPGQVDFSSNLEDDLKRRDFTINALCYSHLRGLVDPYGGIKDLKDKKIRTIGDPGPRLREDYLRILRAVRFASQLDFAIDKRLSRELMESREGLKIISKERIRQEFDKILLAPCPSRGIGILKDHQLLGIIYKDLETMVGFDQKSTFHSLDLYNHTMKTLDGTRPYLPLRLAALFHDIGKSASFFIDDKGNGRFYGHQIISKDLAHDFLVTYKYPKKTIDLVLKLVERHMDNINTYTPKSIRKLMKRVGDDIFLLFDLQEADVRATNQPHNLNNVALGRRLAKEVIDKDLPIEKKDLAINGKDLIASGIKEGKNVGLTLDYLLERVIEDDSLNTYKDLISLAKKYNGG